MTRPFEFPQCRRGNAIPYSAPHLDTPQISPANMYELSQNKDFHSAPGQIQQGAILVSPLPVAFAFQKIKQGQAFLKE